MRERRYTLDTLCHFYANGGWHHPPQTFSRRQHGSTNTNYSDNYRNTIYYTQSATTYNNLWVMWFSNEFYYIITNDVRMMFWRTYLLIQGTCPVIIHLDRELWWNTLHHSHKFVCPHSISTVNLNTCSWERRWLRVVGREKGRRREPGGEVEERGRKRDGRRFYHSKLSQAFLLQELRDWLWGSQNCWFCTCYDEVIWNEFLTCKIYNPFHLPFVPAYGKQLLVCGSSPPLWECQMLCLCWCNAPCSAAGEW